MASPSSSSSSSRELSGDSSSSFFTPDLFLYLSRFTSEEQSQLWRDLAASRSTAKLTISLRGYPPISTLSRHPLFSHSHSQASSSSSPQLVDEIINLFKTMLGYEANNTWSNFALALRCNTHLTSLDLSLNQIGLQGAQELSRVLEHNSTLQQLNLSDNQLGNRGAEALAYGLERNRGLRSLNLSSNAIDHVQLIIHALHPTATTDDDTTASHPLQELNLSCNRVDAAGAQCIAQWLSSPACRLRALTLECVQLGDAAVEHLAQALSSPQLQLQRLDVSHNEIRDAGVSALCLALVHNRTLQQLNLFGNHVGDLGALQLVELVEEHNSVLGQINLGANSCVKPVARLALRQALKLRRMMNGVLAVRSAACVPRLGQHSPLRRLPVEMCVLLCRELL